MIKYIDELKKEDLNGKKVLLRADLDVPVVGGKIQEDFRIKAQKETVDYLVSGGAKVMMVAHLVHEVSDVSFAPIVEELGKILGFDIFLISHKDFFSKTYNLKPKTLYLLDNIRQDLREEKNDDGFARELAKGFDLYVNDAFAVLHRNHASVAAITKYLPSYAGLLVKKEIENLGSAVDAPAEGKILVFGGAKISTKLPVIKNFVGKAEKILIGGAVANNFFKAQGINIGASVVDETVSADIDGKIELPEDVLISADKTGKLGAEPYLINPALENDHIKIGQRPVIFKGGVKDIDPNHLILDIGPETAKHYADIISGAELVVWNGPMGLSEVDAFASGTEVVARAASGARRSIIGGGDTIAAVNKLGLLDRYSFVSTGGGAMLEFLAGNKLPGLEALGYY